jgi:Ca2+/Na+ antiporter
VLTYAGYIFYLYKHSLEHRKNNAQEIQDAYDEVKDEKINYFKILISLVLIYV